jgi:hypothetical protein
MKPWKHRIKIFYAIIRTMIVIWLVIAAIIMFFTVIAVHGNPTPV